MPSIVNNYFGPFDYADNHAGKSVMLQLGKFCIIAVLDDACAGYTLINDEIKKIGAPLSPYQVRELLSHLIFINIHLEDRPVFYSRLSFENGYEIIAKVPDTVKLLEPKDYIVSASDFLKSYLENLTSTFEGKDLLLAEIKEGKKSFLFNEKGEFINHQEDVS